MAPWNAGIFAVKLFTTRSFRYRDKMNQLGNVTARASASTVSGAEPSALLLIVT